MVSSCSALLRQLGDLAERVLERASCADARSQQPAGLGNQDALAPAEPPAASEHGHRADLCVRRPERRCDGLPLRVTGVDEAARLGRIGGSARGHLDGCGHREVGGESNLVGHQHQPEVGSREVQHRPRRSVEQLHLGHPVEHACNHLRQTSEGILAPVDLRHRDPLVRGGECRAGILAGRHKAPAAVALSSTGSWSPMSNGTARVSTTRVTTHSSATGSSRPGTSSANSSPPIGAAKPEGTTSVSRSAALRSTRSPTS